MKYFFLTLFQSLTFQDPFICHPLNKNAATSSLPLYPGVKYQVSAKDILPAAIKMSREEKKHITFYCHFVHINA